MGKYSFFDMEQLLMPGSECEATLASPCPVRSGIDVRGGCHLNFFGPWILTGQRFQLSLGRSGLETSKKNQT